MFLGIDEVGVGALAGPVFIAMVAFDKSNVPAGLRDSKKLTKIARERLCAEIIKLAMVCEIESASEDEIETYNIRGAVNVAIRRAFSRIGITPEAVYMDGTIDPKIGCKVICIKGGDDIVAEISAASIVAKVTRDKLMANLGHDFPMYNWQKNAGYPTREHKEALEKHGRSPHHRLRYSNMASHMALLPAID